MRKSVCAAMLTTAFTLVSMTAFGHPSGSLNTIKTLPIGDVPESITIDHAGNLYFSDLSTIQKLTPSGTQTTFSTLPIPVFALGVKVGPDGCVYNTSVSLNPSVAGAFVWKTCTEGSTAQVFATLDPAGGPNDLAFDDCGNIFVTDPFLGRVYKVTHSGTPSIWLQDSRLDGNPADPFLKFHSVGVDGIAFDLTGRNLYLGNLDYGKIFRVPIRWDGSAGPLQLFAQSSRLVGIDGFAMSLTGDIFAAINGQEHLVKIDPFGFIHDLYDGPPLDSVSSVVFGTRPLDKTNIYVSSSAFLKTFGFTPGTPAPAIHKMKTFTIGVPLP